MTVTVYSKPGCNPCRMTKIQLEKHGIPFMDIDITQDADAYQFVKDSGHQQVPLLVAGDQMVSGFRADFIKELAASVATESQGCAL